MNISFEKIDSASAELTIQIEKADYEEKVAKELKQIRKKSQMPGFRPGNAPIGIIQKRFGTQVKVEEVQKIVSTEMQKYIETEKIATIGYPIQSDKTQSFDFAQEEQFTFVFDVALEPVIEVSLGKEDNLKLYTKEVTDTMIDNFIESTILGPRATSEKVDEYADGDVINGYIAQLDENGNVLEGGIQNEDASFSPKYLQGEDEKAKFNGSKANDVIIFNPAKAFGANVAGFASTLKCKSEEVKDLTANFSFQITSITRYVTPELNQELIDQYMLGEGVVNGVDEFRNYLREQFEAINAANFRVRFLEDLNAHMLEKIGEVQFAEQILKKSMKVNIPDATDEKIDEEYPQLKKELVWDIVLKNLIQQFEVKLENADVEQMAKTFIRQQYLQYGMLIPANHAIVEQSAKSLLEDKEKARVVFQQALNAKLADAIIKALEPETVTLAEDAAI